MYVRPIYVYKQAQVISRVCVDMCIYTTTFPSSSSPSPHQQTHTHTLTPPRSYYDPDGRFPPSYLPTSPPSPTLHNTPQQSYYDPDGRFHPAPASEAVTPGKMALGNLGLELVAYIHDAATDTHAILARGALVSLGVCGCGCGDGSSEGLRERGERRRWGRGGLACGGFFVCA
jgi:hypothetical protein